MAAYQDPGTVGGHLPGASMTTQVLLTIDMVDHDSDMFGLYNLLKDWLQQKFGTAPTEFAPHERLVFVHHDLDYFLTTDHPGFTLYNLQLILRELDIPNFFCLVISNIPGFDHYVRRVRDILRPDDVPMRALTRADITDYAAVLPPHSVMDTSTITHPFVCLSRQSRFHRTFFMSRLWQRDLQQQGLVSYHNIPARIDNLQAVHRWYPDDVPFSFLYTVPHKRQNTEMPLRIAHNRQVVRAFQNTVQSWCNFHDSTDIQDKGQSMHFRNSVVARGAVYMALETTVCYPRPYVSTISFKGMAEHRPSVIFGVPGTLAHLRDLGFQTFDQWWDEGYDSIPDPEIRVERILDVLEYISALDAGHQRAMLEDMRPVLDHNYHHLRHTLLERYQQQYQDVLAQQFL